MLTDLLAKRRRQFHKQVLKYLRLLFNDQFTILILFVLGAGGFLYRELLLVLTPQMRLPKLVLALVFTFLVGWGQVPTYTKTADKLFLLPKINQFRPSLQTYSKQTLILKALGLLLALFILSPMIRLTSGYQWPEVVAIALLVFAGQACSVYLSYKSKLSPTTYQERNWSGWLYLAVFLLTYASLVINPFLVSGLGIVFLVFSVGVITNLDKSDDFILIEPIIQAENQRKHRIYRFFNLVTDVPQVSEKTSSRFKLKGLVRLLAGSEPSRASYLISRVFLRQGNYRNLIVRLTIVASILLVLSNQVVFSILFSAMFLLMALIQVLPLADDLKRRPALLIHPLNQSEILQGIENLCFKIAGFMTVIFALVGALNGFTASLAILIVNLILTLIFNKLYLSRKLAD